MFENMYRGPQVAPLGSLEGTTTNVCAYSATSRDGKYNFFLLDYEGAYGGTSHSLKEMWKKTLDLLSSQSSQVRSSKQFERQ
jgi:hypothetical protein